MEKLASQTAIKIDSALHKISCMAFKVNWLEIGQCPPCNFALYNGIIGALRMSIMCHWKFSLPGKKTSAFV